ncbi:hypothetical protein AGOR_G00178670 [Albula goreensis]|uniref:Uncharacterized protein n=1 Tax=Albula goreensis TaxID=1534307 RepID=A0A8T3D0D0_9TELE|nr:hypothetical protein AGOR_G00178670 [Albula goreensis]
MVVVSRSKFNFMTLNFNTPVSNRFGLSNPSTGFSKNGQAIIAEDGRLEFYAPDSSISLRLRSGFVDRLLLEDEMNSGSETEFYSSYMQT